MLRRTETSQEVTPQVKPASIDEYLSSQPSDKKAALQSLREAIRTAVPKAEECIAYGIPGFRLNGRYLVGFGAAAKHCSFYLGSTLQAYQKQLQRYETSKGTIRFASHEPLPAALVRKLVKARVAQMTQS